MKKLIRLLGSILFSGKQHPLFEKFLCFGQQSCLSVVKFFFTIRIMQCKPARKEYFEITFLFRFCHEQQSVSRFNHHIIVGVAKHSPVVSPDQSQRKIGIFFFQFEKGFNPSSWHPFLVELPGKNPFTWWLSGNDALDQNSCSRVGRSLREQGCCQFTGVDTEVTTRFD